MSGSTHRKSVLGKEQVPSATQLFHGTSLAHLPRDISEPMLEAAASSTALRLLPSLQVSALKASWEKAVGAEGLSTPPHGNDTAGATAPEPHNPWTGWL